MKDGLCGPRENPCLAPGPPGCCPLTPLCVAGVWRSPEQVAAGQEAGVRMPFPVRRVPVLLHHDGVQRVHLRELAHVRGTLIHRAAHRGSVPSFLCNTRAGRTPSHRGLQGRASISPLLFTGLRSCLSGPGAPCPLPRPSSSWGPTCHPAFLAHPVLPPRCEDFSIST